MQVTSGDRTWTVRRTIQNFRMLDQKLHRCIYDRKFSHLPEIGALELDEISPQVRKMGCDCGPNKKKNVHVIRKIEKRYS